MKFSLFRKTKQEPKPKAKTEGAKASTPEAPNPEPVAIEPKQETPVAPQEAAPKAEPTQEQKLLAQAEPATKTYLKAMPLKELSDVENVKAEVKNGNIIILRVTPLAAKSIEDVKTAVNQLYEFAEQVGGDIARLGEERIVMCPKNIRIWREKSPTSATPIPTAAPTAA